MSKAVINGIPADAPVFGKAEALRAELTEAKAEIERLTDLLDAAEQACEDRADLLDDFGLESECCAATARNCAADIDALKGSSQ